MSRADQVERAGDRPAVAIGEEQQQPVAHRLAEQVEEGAGQIGMAPFAARRCPGRNAHIASHSAGPISAPRSARELQPLARRRALLADRLALAAGQRGEEIVEVGIAAVAPVILDAVRGSASRAARIRPRPPRR